VYISIRPYAISFLKRCSKYFEIIAFTASEKCYADAILNEIDPDRQYIQHRLYREHCVKLHNKVYAKDLSIINRDLSKMVLVDNSPLSFLYQVENAIPILPYHAGEDSELLLLEKYLDRIRL
jgi:CTD small phosphatase-like protein 2